MQEKTTIARPYAQAVFELAQESNSNAHWSAMLGLLKRIASDVQMRQLFNNPGVTQQQLQDLVIQISGDALTAEARNFVRVLVGARRLQYMPQIAELFEIKRAEAEGTVDVQVSAAYELDQAQQDSIEKGISARLGKKVKISATTEKPLIGGAIIRAGDSVIDASVRGRLTKLRNDLI